LIYLWFAAQDVVGKHFNLLLRSVFGVVGTCLSWAAWRFYDARAAKALKSGEHIVVQACPYLRLEASVSTKSWTCRYRSLADAKAQTCEVRPLAHHASRTGCFRMASCILLRSPRCLSYERRQAGRPRSAPRNRISGLHTGTSWRRRCREGLVDGRLLAKSVKTGLAAVW